MTEATDELLRHLAEGWTALLVQILESMTDQKPKVRLEGRRGCRQARTSSGGSNG